VENRLGFGHMMKMIAAVLWVGLCLGAVAQEGRMVVDQTTADTAVANSAVAFPKFHREYEYVKAHDPLIKKINLIRMPGMGRGPAFASPNGVIAIDINYLDNPKPNFDDNRLVVVLYHELGHLHYYEQAPRSEWTEENSEKAAFEYSLLKTKEMAEKGDCGPLATGVKFMKLRSESSNLQDAHVRALKRIVNEPMYAGYVEYVKTHCAATAAQ
jgi:hypothetical protein